MIPSLIHKLLDPRFLAFPGIYLTTFFLNFKFYFIVVRAGSVIVLIVFHILRENLKIIW